LTGATPGSSSSLDANAATSSKTFAKGLAISDANLNLAVTEDLGGGLKAQASYLLETGFHRGAAVTRADSSISLGGGFGSVAVRNTRNSDQLSGIMSAAVNLPDGIYDSTGILSRSSIDTASYTSNEIIPGLRASLTYVEANDGNQSVTSVNGSQNVLGASYTAGPLTVGAAYKMKPKDATAVAATFTSTATTANTWGLKPKANAELSVSYNLGFATVAYAYDGATSEGTATAADTTTLGTAALDAAAIASRAVALAGNKAANGLSVTVPMGAVSLGLNYAKRGDFTYTGVGATYAFSKRTSLSFATGTKSAKDADAAVQTALRDSSAGNVVGVHGSQYRIALKHTF